MFYHDSKLVLYYLKTTNNTVGLINWLRQPGQIRNAIESQ